MAVNEVPAINISKKVVLRRKRTQRRRTEYRVFGLDRKRGGGGGRWRGRDRRNKRKMKNRTMESLTCTDSFYPSSNIIRS
jgi:hypothetical protein